MESRSFDIVLAEARRALDQQAGDVARVRERTANLVGIGALAAAFIGGLALRDDAPLTAWTIAGAAAFAALLLVAIVVMRPRKFAFTQHAQLLVAYAEKPTATAERLARNLALRLDADYRGNAKSVDRLTFYYGIGLALLVLEVSLLLFDLRGR